VQTKKSSNKKLKMGKDMSDNLSCSRRRFSTGVAAVGIAAGLGLPKYGFAASFPDQTINFLIPYGPGGGFDSYVRKFSELLPTTLPNKVNVEPLNDPGASGEKAIFNLLQSPPDGYNISLINVPGIIESNYKGKGGNININSLTWVATLGREAYGIAVGAHSSIKTIADLKKLSTQRVVSFGSTGPGSTDYFATRVFAAAEGLNVRQVTGYNGAVESGVAAARGDVDCVIHSLAVLGQMAGSGLVRIIFAFQDKTALAGVEDASSIGQPDLGEIYQWFPVVAPPGLPPEITLTLSNALVKAAGLPDAETWAKSAHTTLYPLNQAETLKMVATQTAIVAKWKSAL
jgi:tripartite-type tricarboxylate transporter receptor subunit TctC